MTSKVAAKTIKLSLDLICVLIALVLISFGLYVLLSYDVKDVSLIVSYSYIGIGIAVILVTALGTSAAIFENVCCLITFIVLLIILIIVQIIVVYTLTFNVDSIASNFANTLEAVWEEELKSPGAMSIYESWLNCCGRASPQDYIVNDRFPPSTCFVNGDATKVDNLIGKGCRLEFENYWMGLLNVFNILAWILLTLELLGSFISCCLCNSIRNEKRRTYF